MTPEERARETLMILDVANFIGHFDPDHMQGGVKAEEAFSSFCKLLGLPEGKLLNIARGAPETEQEAQR